MTQREPNHQRFQKDNGIKRILVVDDEYDISLAIKVVLEENGFKVDSFNDASQALENFMTGIYDLVLLDVKMPLSWLKLQVLSRPGSHLGSTDTFVDRSLPLEIDFSSKFFLDFLHKLLSHIVSGFFVSAWVQLSNIQCRDRVDDMNAAK